VIAPSQSFDIVPGVAVGAGKPLLIAGPCVIEGEDMILRHADTLASMMQRLGAPFVFKSSYDKANRTSGKSFRGLGIVNGLRILQRVKEEFALPILTDVHSVEETAIAAEVADVIQIPAFLCRQTDLLEAAAQTGRVVNVKKGQWVAPEDVGNIIAKVTDAGGGRVMITERGSSFGYHRLVVDYAGLVRMRSFGWPVIFDATHSVQSPGGSGDRSGGDRTLAPYLAWAAAAVGVSGLFVETHENPDSALSDGPNMIPLHQLESVLRRFLDIAALS